MYGGSLISPAGFDHRRVLTFPILTANIVGEMTARSKHGPRYVIESSFSIVILLRREMLTCTTARPVDMRNHSTSYYLAMQPLRTTHAARLFRVHNGTALCRQPSQGTSFISSE